MGNCGWCCLKYSVIAVMHCLCYLAFGLAQLLSQLNHAETPNLYSRQQIHIKGIGAPIGGSSVGINTSPINLAWRLVLVKRYIIQVLGVFLITLLVNRKAVQKFYHQIRIFYAIYLKGKVKVKDRSEEVQGIKQTLKMEYSKISLVRYRLFGRAYHNINGIVILRIIYQVNRQEKKELNT